MEIFFKRFPLASKMILNNLDDQSLTRSKQANRGIANLLENERFFWIRILKKCNENFKGFEESWKQAINKTPVDAVKQLAIVVQEFSKFNHYLKIPPAYIVVKDTTVHELRLI